MAMPKTVDVYIALGKTSVDAANTIVGLTTGIVKKEEVNITTIQMVVNSAFAIVDAGLDIPKLTNTVALGLTITKVVTSNDPLLEAISLGDILDAASALAGFTPYGKIAGLLVTSFNVGYTAGTLLNKWVIDDLIDGLTNPTVVSKSIGTTPDPLVKTIIYVDPLVFDLDGDGLEISPISQGVIFDTNGDGIKTGTAWIGQDDGLLVLDLNGNGVIDSGRELFGDETYLKNGQKAADGFAALADIDTGSLLDKVIVGANDKVFDEKDAMFSKVKIWRDLNQDGISQANELKGLLESNIKSIKLANKTVNENYGDAILTHTGTFNRTVNGEGQVGSFILAQNNFDRIFDPVTISENAASLPNILGTGMVRDLQEAATLETDLFSTVDDLYHVTTREEFRRGVESLLKKWGNSSDYQSASDIAIKSGYGLILSNPYDDQERSWMDVAIKASKEERENYRSTLTTEDRNKFDAMRERMVGDLEKLYAYEAFTAYTFLNWSRITKDVFSLDYIDIAAANQNGRPIEVLVPLSHIIRDNPVSYRSIESGYILVNIPDAVRDISHINALWDRLVDDAMSNLMPQFRLAKYLDLITLNVNEKNSISFDFSQLDERLTTEFANNSFEGTALFLDLYKVYGKDLNNMGWASRDRLVSLIEQAETNVDVKKAFDEVGYHMFSADSHYGTEESDIYTGNAQSNTFYAGAGSDVLLGKEGQDNLYGQDGDDLLTGGAGKDILDGGYGHDSYIYGHGDGQDQINNYDDNSADQDKIFFKAGVLVSDVTLVRVNDDLQIRLQNGDVLTISSHFYDIEGRAPYAIDELKFADGTVWDKAAIKAKVLLGGDNDEQLIGFRSADVLAGNGGNDTLNGGVGDDVLEGGVGNDTLFGGDGYDQYSPETGEFMGHITGGNDSLNGAAGQDNLYGQDGDDVLEGGTGNDTLEGGYGNDSYVYGHGDGQDIINNYDDSPTTQDKIVFKAGVSVSDVTLVRVNDGLQIRLQTGDVLTVNNHFSDIEGQALYAIDQLVFADGTVWNKNEILVRAVSEELIYEYLYGDENNNILVSLDSQNSYISAGDGDDVLEGGTGSDTLEGGYGHDSYVYGHGDGQDLINNYDDNPASQDKVVLKQGVSVSDVTLVRVNDDLQIRLQNGDVLTVSSHFYDIEGRAPYAIDELKFADGTVWDKAVIKAKVLLGGDNDEQLIGFNSADVLVGNGGNDYLNGGLGDDVLAAGIGNDILLGGEGYDEYSTETGEFIGHVSGGNDSLNGGAGQDVLYGQDGDDVLEGGTGNDTLEGGYGNDSYVYGHGDGQDIINNYDNSPTTQDKIVFKAGVSVSDVTLVRMGEDLQIHLQGGDILTISNHFSDIDGQAVYAIDELKFADGTVWDTAAMKAKVLLGEDNDDWLIGFNSADVLSGNGGNDYLNGGVGDDVLEGGVGNDTLFGGGGYDEYSPETGEFIGHISGGNDSLKGGAGQDYLYGQDGDDVLEGGIGNDTLNGGDGNDSYVYGHGDGQDHINNYDDSLETQDKVVLKQGVSVSDVTLVRVNDDLQIRLQNGDVLTVTYHFSDIDGQAQYAIDTLEFADGTVWTRDQLSQMLSVDNVAQGTDGDDIFWWDGKPSVMRGGKGNDIYYIDDVSDVIVEFANEGNDLVNTDISLVLGDEFEDITLTGSAFSATGNKLANTIMGNSADNLLQGNEGNDFLSGRAGNDTLDGGTGKDSMQGGVGDDTYIIDNPDDLVVEFNGNGFDTVRSTVTTLLSHNLEVLKLEGLLEINAIGNTSDNWIYGNKANNYLEGMLGNDYLNGDLGNDTYSVGANLGSDTIEEAHYDENGLIMGGAGGDDTVILSNINYDDVVFSRSIDANDLIISIKTTNEVLTIKNGLNKDVNWHVEHFQFSDQTVNLADIMPLVINRFGSSSDDFLYGSIEGDKIYGLAGNDTLLGSEGNDSLLGGLGSDSYLFDHSMMFGQDLIDDNEGLTTINLTGVILEQLSFTQLENDLVLTIKDSTNTISVKNFFDSNNLNYKLVLEDGTLLNKIAVLQLVPNNLVITGTAGSDVLQGGIDNDIYIVNHARDVIKESINNTSIDTVQASVSYVLLAGLENLILTGTANLSGTGNSSDNSLQGNTGNNRLLAGDGNDTLNGGAGGDTLNGGNGADVMYGGTGNDTFTVQDIADVVIEFANEGYDSVNSFITYTLTANVERLNLENSGGAINGVGNELDNTLNGNNFANLLIGGAGNDTLQGKGGADTLEGGFGDDVYYVDNIGDVVTELTNQGIDKVNSTISYSLTANVEQLFLTGIAGLSGTGNDLNNTIYGNNGNNMLSGGAGNDSLNGGVGNDTLEGGLGFDTLVGGTGNDTYLLNLNSGRDIINNTDVNNGNDKLLLGAGINADQVWLRKLGNDLEVSIIGTNNSAKIQNWYSDANKRLDSVQLADGKVLLEAEVQNLVDAMASFTMPAIGQTSLTTVQHNALDSIILASW